MSGAQGEEFRLLFLPQTRLGRRGFLALIQVPNTEDKKNPWCGGCFGSSAGSEHQDGPLTSFCSSSWGKAVPGHPLDLCDPSQPPTPEKCCPTPLLAPGRNLEPAAFLLLWDLFIYCHSIPSLQSVSDKPLQLQLILV